MTEAKARQTSPLRLFALKAYTDSLQDGVSIICIILRHIDAEAVDFDTLLYWYLKVRANSKQGYEPPRLALPRILA